MKKVFLVDDEIAIREGVRNSIRWETEGFIFAGDASDGELALPQIEMLAPDILVTDIKMPFMDGLQLSRIVKKKIPGIKIIVLSGHDEFSYAQEALRIGVTEYCLKPINSAELLNVLHCVSKQIDIEHTEQKEKDDLIRKISTNIELEKEKLLLDLCTGTIHSSTAIEEANRLGINLISAYYSVCMIEFMPEGLHEPRSESMEELIQSTIAYIGAEAKEFILIRRLINQTIWLLKGEQLDSIENAIDKVRTQLESMKHASSEVEIIISSGAVKNRLQEISLSYAEAEQEVHYRRFLKRHLPSAEVLLEIDRNRLIEFLKIGDSSKADDFIDSYLSELSLSANDLPRYGQYVIVDTFVTVAQFIRESGGDCTIIIAKMEALKDNVSFLPRLQEVRFFIRETILAAFAIRDQSKNKNADIILKAKSYIDSHFEDPEISLQTLSSHVNVSASYFSSLFSQATGQTFIEYLTKRRMSRAMELLKSTNLKTYEIAEKVGYNDPHYFNTLFKRVTGKTTKVFRYEA